MLKSRNQRWSRLDLLICMYIKGHVKVLTSSIQRLKKQHGIETAETFAAFVSDQIYALKNVVETEELDCEFELRRSYDVFLDDDEGQQAEQHFRESVRNGEHWTKETNLVLKPNVEEVCLENRHACQNLLQHVSTDRYPNRSHLSKAPKSL